MQLTEGVGLQVALGALILYLAAHGLTGQQGLISYIGLQAKERVLAEESARLAAHIETLSDRANRLRTGSATFDRDYLEERARVVIGAVRTDEVVFDLAEGPGSGQFAALP